MSRLIFVPQFPTKLRYQEFWYTELEKHFKKHYDEVLVLGDSYVKNEKETQSEKSMFSPIQQAINLELIQINEFYNLKIYDEDILFLSDISFPGLFCNILHHKRCKRMYCYVHGTSRNKMDYFELCKESKWLVEKGHSKLFNKIFLASEYHQNKLGWKNTQIVGLPIPPFETFREDKIHDIISVARPTAQKVNQEIENEIEKDFGKIVRKECNSWDEYYRFLSMGKILLITSREDTFNYSLLESINNNTIVLAPNKIVFPELLELDYLYNDIDDLKNKLRYYLNTKLYKIPVLKCIKKVNNFYKVLIEEIKK